MKVVSMSEVKPKRFGIYYDPSMLEDERLVKDSFKRRGIKPTRPNVIRYLLAQEAERIRQATPKK